MEAGKRLENSLQEQMGNTARSAIHFPDTDELILEEGETIGSQHLGKVQSVVKAHLEELERDLKEHKQQDLDSILMDTELKRSTADVGMEELRGQLEDQALQARDENSRLRDELLELRTLTFMGESRYRELKSRWGQVFRADMGAEAFYDILRRMDLDKLAEELWQEVRTSRSNGADRTAGNSS
jgi:DNA-directed RNA polymerase subunit beta'